MKYKVGDIVKVKSLNWYNKNKNEYGDVTDVKCHFVTGMKIYCGKFATINWIGKEYSDPYYRINIDLHEYNWSEGMFENIKNIRRKKLKKINSLSHVQGR